MLMMSGGRTTVFNIGTQSEICFQLVQSKGFIIQEVYHKTCVKLIVNTNIHYNTIAWE